MTDSFTGYIHSQSGLIITWIYKSLTRADTEIISSILEYHIGILIWEAHSSLWNNSGISVCYNIVSYISKTVCVVKLHFVDLAVIATWWHSDMSVCLMQLWMIWNMKPGDCLLCGNICSVGVSNRMLNYMELVWFRVTPSSHYFFQWMYMEICDSSFILSVIAAIKLKSHVFWCLLLMYTLDGMSLVT